VERVTGIEPAQSAWKAMSLSLDPPTYLVA
jgi:hypothetical protein